MFSSKIKHRISEKVQEVLKELDHPELPSEEIQFLLHVDGAEDWSWANIYNNEGPHSTPPTALIRNTTVTNIEW